MFYSASELVVCLSVIIGVTLILYVKYCSGRLPGPFNFPLVGILPLLLWRSYKNPKDFRFFKFILDLNKQYGPAFRFNLGVQEWVVLGDYDTIREALIENGDIFSNRPQSPFFKLISENKSGIVFSEGLHWLHQRKFAVRGLNTFGCTEKVEIEAVELVRRLKNLCGKPVKTRDIFAKYVINVISEILFNERIGTEDPEMNNFLKQMKIFTGTNIEQLLMMLYPFLSSKIFMPFLPNSRKAIDADKWAKKKFMKKISVIRDRYDKEEEPTNLIEAYVQEFPEGAEDNGMLQTVIDLLFGGTETSSNTLRWLILLASVHPTYQQLCYQEISKEFSADMEIRFNKCAKLHYVRAFIEESMRFSSIAPSAILHRTNSNVLFHGGHISNKAHVVVNLMGVHFDSKYFCEPEVFTPQRFLDATGVFKSSQYHNSFGIGRRSCLGKKLALMELVTVFASVILHFEVSLDKDTPEHRQNVLLGLDGITRAPGQHAIIFKDRHA